MTDFLLLALIFLAAGVFAVPIASRLGLGSVLGYLIAGVAISPALNALHVDVIAIQHFAEFGVVMMLFLVGLELEPRLLWEMRTKLLGLGGLQVTATALLIMAVALMAGQPWSVALAIGLVLALSSTAIVLQTLNEKGLMKSDGGQAGFSVLLFQDIAVIPMLALIPLLALPELAAMDVAAASEGDGHGSGLSLIAGLAGWQAALVTLAAVAFVVFAGTHLTPPVFHFIASAGLRELFTATALMFVVGIALLMMLVGLSPALGTFLAGVVLANSEFRHELESDIDPFRGLLLGLFFMTVGAGINFGLLFDQLGTILLLTFGLIAVKASVLLVLGNVFKIPGADRWLFGLGLAQAGEFGFVLLSLTVANHVIPVSIADQLLLIVALSMLLTPALFILHEKLIAPRFAETQTAESDDIDEPGDIIIAGNGRFGGVINRMLRAAGYSATVLDYSSEQLQRLRVFGVKVFFGDATRPDLLHAAGIANARILIIAIDDKAQITHLVEYVSRHYPQVHIIARAVDRPHVFDLWAAGCRDVIRETFDSAVRAGRSAYEALGHHPFDAEQLARKFTEDDRAMIRRVAQSYNPRVPIHENHEFVDLTRQLMAETEARIFDKNRAFSIRTDRGWSPPTLDDVAAADASRNDKQEAKDAEG